MNVRELLGYYEKEINHLLQDQMRFPYDDLAIMETIDIYRQFIKYLKQLS